MSAILEPSLKPPKLPEAFVIWFFVLNLGSVIAIVFGLLYYFVAQRNFFQERSETLILNILPKEISDALKVKRSGIAAITNRRASCLPMSSALPRWPRRWFRSAWSTSSMRFSQLRRSRRKAWRRED